MPRQPFLTLTLLASTLSACDAELDGTIDHGADFRAAMISETWSIDGPTSLPDLDSCDDYWNDRCASLTPTQCSIAQNRHACSESSGAVVIIDNFGELAPEIEWDGHSLGDAGLYSGASAAATCESMQGIELEQCFALAQIAEHVGSKAQVLLQAFPSGGFASLSIDDGAIAVGPGSVDDQLEFAAADTLGWKVPMIADICDLGSIPGLVFEDHVMVSVRPNGTIGVSTTYAAMLQKPKEPPPPPVNYIKTYFMSASGAAYNSSALIVVGSWPLYAAQWKAYVDPYVHQAILHAMGSAQLLLGAENQLNFNEEHHFTTVSNGQVVQYDPNGIWMSVDIDDPLTGFIYSAIVMHYWQSPVFFAGYLTAPLNVAPAGSWYNDIALEQLTFHIPSAPDLHAACGLPSSMPADQALAAIQSCNFGGTTLQSAVVTAWPGHLSPSNAPYLHHQSLPGANLMSAYAAGYHWDKFTPSGRVGELIFDPPADADPEEIAAVLGLAEFIADEVRAQVSMEEFVQ